MATRPLLCLHEPFYKILWGMGEIIQSKKDGKLYEIDHATGAIKCLESPREYLIDRSPPFELDIALGILEKVRGGLTLIDAAEANGINTNTLHSWRRIYPDFGKRVEEALEDRAYHFEDRMLELLDDPDVSPNELSAKVQAYEKLAKFGNRKRYSDRVRDDEHAGVTFIINTGVPNQVPINIKEVISYEENETDKNDGRGELDSLEGDRSGGNGSDYSEWYSSDSNRDSIRASDGGDGGDSGGEDTDSSGGDSKRPQQELFGGVGSDFTRRGNGEERI